jgi:hypothetical protein
MTIASDRTYVVDRWADLVATRRLAVLIVLVAAALVQGKSQAGVVTLSYVDDSAEGKRSIAGSGHAVRFERPDNARFVEAVRIFASRYGHPKPPKEDFHVYVLNDKQQVLADVRFPYGMVKRAGELQWHTLPTPSIEVPEVFYVVLSFNPHQTKGVYLGYDESVDKSRSLTGLPGDGFRPVDKAYDWMVRVEMSAKPSGKKGVKRLADFSPPVEVDPFAGMIEAKYDDGKSDGRQSYGGSGPMITFKLADVLPKNTAVEDLAVAGVRLFASRYGGGYDPDTTMVKLTVRNDKNEVVREQEFAYATFGRKAKWVDLVLPKPLPLTALGSAPETLTVAVHPNAHRTKGIFFHYNKVPKESHSSAINRQGKVRPASDREWLIRVFLRRVKGRV